MAVGELHTEILSRRAHGHDEASSLGLAHQLQHALHRRLREAAATRGPLGLDLPSPLIGHGAAQADPFSLDRTLALRAKLAKPETAAALTRATFLPWLSYPERLELGGLSDFRELHFDARCPTGIRGTPPVVDFMALGPGGAVGAAVHCLDYLALRTRKTTTAYASLELPAELRPWAAFLAPNDAVRNRFRHIDANAMARMAVGLGKIFARRPVRLLYLFLEPEDAAGLRPFRQHRGELAELADATAESSVNLVASSLGELWTEWLASDPPLAVRGIVAELRHRYAVAMPTPARL